jgi:hypothetical protein
MGSSMRRSPWWLAVAVPVALLAAGAVWMWNSPARRPDAVRPTFDLPEPSASPFLNATAAAEYVGIQACAECHPGEYRSYRKTAHSQALADLDPKEEPADAQFHHAASGRTYSIYRAGGRMHHRGVARDKEGQEYVVEDIPIRYRIGSGHYTRSYLIDVDGFLSESPLTWYATRGEWKMSPGYDRANHKGFERAADSTCLFCHVGRTSSPDENYQRLTILEQAIGCERCHGPGSLHAAQERDIRAGVVPEARRRPAIVHPAQLSRSLREALCAQCHLHADSAVALRGRSLNDFRPGLRLSDFCVDYRLDEPDAQMKVVGHVDQLHLSRCYQKSEELTCTTCHDPHAASPPQHPQYVKVCLKCHTDAGCKLPRPERLRRNGGDDCLACHMPRVGTDIPHIAFTHHRIGIHGERPSAPAARPAASPTWSRWTTWRICPRSTASATWGWPTLPCRSSRPTRPLPPPTATAPTESSAACGRRGCPTVTSWPPWRGCAARTTRKAHCSWPARPWPARRSPSSSGSTPCSWPPRSACSLTTSRPRARPLSN